MAKKFVLEFDEEPALVFVQHKTGDIQNAEFYQDGKEVKGVVALRIEAEIDHFTTHSIGYMTGATKSE
jgi:hypothetical protein